MYMYRMSFLLLLLGVIALPAQAQDGGLENLRQTGKAFASVARQVSPSVVYIQVESTQEGATMAPFTSPFTDEFFKRFFGEPLPGMPQGKAPQNQRREVSQGSGFVFASKTDYFPTRPTYSPTITWLKVLTKSV